MPITRPNLEDSSTLTFFTILVVLMFGVYFYYEMFVQTSVRFPKDDAEAAALFGGSTVDLIRIYSIGWWALQAHHFFLLGIFFLIISYTCSVVNFKSSVGGLCGWLTVFWLLFIVVGYFIAALVWYGSICSGTASCPAILTRVALPGPNVIQVSQRNQIWIFYFIMIFLAAVGGAIAVCFPRFQHDKYRRYKEGGYEKLDMGSIFQQGKTGSGGGGAFQNTAVANYGGNLTKRATAHQYAVPPVHYGKTYYSTTAAQLFAKSLKQKAQQKSK